MGSSNRTGLSLDIKIVGAGVAGLASGLALVRAGHRVTVFEANPALSEIGAGLQLSSNATRILRQWGLEQDFVACVNAPDILSMRRYEDDSVIGEIAHNPDAEWRYGAPHWQIYRPDLQRLLADAAVRAGVVLECGRPVTKVDPRAGELVFPDGSKLSADLVVLADGINSRLRACIPENADTRVRAIEAFCFRATVPREKMDSDPETARLMTGRVTMGWLGPNVTALGYTVASGEKYNTLITVPRPSDASLEWSQPGDPDEARATLDNFCPSVKKVWSYVDSCIKWTIGDLPEIGSYRDRNGKCILVGDAAHAMIPHAAQGAGMALEDAAALPEFLAKLNHPNELPEVMKRFETFRKARVENIRRIAYGNRRLLTLEDGPEQEERDRLWGAMTSKWKAEVEELGEEGMKAQEKATADPDAPDIRTPEARAYMYGYDVVAESRKFLSSGK